MGDTVDAGDYVTVTDALSVHLSGKKSSDKVYVSHTGFMGGLKEVPIGRMRERRPEEVSLRVCDLVLCFSES
jgi:large subunit ribosomal protein L13